MWKIAFINFVYVTESRQLGKTVIQKQIDNRNSFHE